MDHPPPSRRSLGSGEDRRRHKGLHPGGMRTASLMVFLTLGAMAAQGSVPAPGSGRPVHTTPGHEHAHPPRMHHTHHTHHTHHGVHTGMYAPTLSVDRATRTVTLTAEATPGAFRASTSPDHRYHALVSRSGGAAGKALMVTDTPDHEIAAALRSLGANDGGGVPMNAWDHRAIPFVPGPSSRVAGTRVDVLVTWEGAGETHRLSDLIDDPGGEGIEVRFGGNEEHDDHWPSGCIFCLYSCPGGVLSNERYTIRDHRRGNTSFDPGDTFPPDGTVLTITLQIIPG